MEYVILHFVGLDSENEKLVIVEAPASEEDRTPPVRFKLYKEYPADIEGGCTLPLGRTLIRSDR